LTLFFSQVTRTSAAGLEQEKNGPFLSQVTPTSAAGLKQEKFWVPFFPDGAPAAHAQKKIWTPFGAGGASSHRRKKIIPLFLTGINPGIDAKKKLFPCCGPHTHGRKNYFPAAGSVSLGRKIISLLSRIREWKKKLLPRY